MTQIIDIDRYLCTGALIYMSEGIFPKPCQEVKMWYESVLNGGGMWSEYYNNSKLTISDQKLDYQLPPLSSDNVTPLVIVGGIFENTTNETQNFTSLEIVKRTSTVTRSSTTYGFKTSTKIGSSTTVKAEIPFVGGGETTLSMEFSFETDFSKTNEIVKTDETELKIPPQSITVEPGQKKRLEVELYKVAIPEATFTIDGDVAGRVYTPQTNEVVVYDFLSKINNRCPGTYANVDKNLQLDSGKKTLHFKGEGKAAFEIMAVEYVMRIITLDNKTGATLNEETAVRQLSRTIEKKSPSLS